MDSSKILLSILLLVLGIALFIVWIWVVRKYIFRTGNFTCCRCRKEYPQKHETEKNLCRWCKEKKKKK